MEWAFPEKWKIYGNPHEKIVFLSFVTYHFHVFSIFPERLIPFQSHVFYSFPKSLQIPFNRVPEHTKIVQNTYKNVVNRYEMHRTLLNIGELSITCAG